MAHPLADFRGEAIYLDAIHLAVIKRLRLRAIASDDEGFDQYQDQGISLFKPE